jgi:hypothetical protein
MRAIERMATAGCAVGFSPLRAFQVINTITTFVNASKLILQQAFEIEYEVNVKI